MTFVLSEINQDYTWVISKWKILSHFCNDGNQKNIKTEGKQQHIGSEYESKCTICENIEETIPKSLLQAETLRQRILYKEYEGKLV